MISKSNSYLNELIEHVSCLFVLLAVSTLEELTTNESISSASTSSLNDGTLTSSSATTLTNNNLALPIPNNSSKDSSNRSTSSTRPDVKSKMESSEERRTSSLRSNSQQVVKRQRRAPPNKNQRRLLQYELMPTGKVYYVNRPVYKDYRPNKSDPDDNSSVNLSTILSRSSSLDTLSDKHYRHQQMNKHQSNLTSKKPESKLSVGGRLASNHNLASPNHSSFKPIRGNKKRFSSFEPTPQSLDRVFDVLIAADKRREEHEFWKERFDQRPMNIRTLGNARNKDLINTNTNTIPFLRSKQQPSSSNSTLTKTAKADYRSQSYTNQSSGTYETMNRPATTTTTLLEDCLRRRTLTVQQRQQVPSLPPTLQRNYSPNTIYSTNYPKQQLPSSGKPPLPTPTKSSQPVRILPLNNSRLARAPQARQTSDEISSTSDVWAARSSFEDETQHGRKPTQQLRFPSAISRSRTIDKQVLNSKRASSVEQRQTHQTNQKNLSNRSKFFDLFKFNR
jgi:hypothetical protein